MKKKRKREYLRILELGGNASRDDIENAYSHFVKLYSSEDSPEIHPLKEEISVEERKKILSDIDEAYKALVGEDGVNRVDFSAVIEPQEIILDEDDPVVIEHEEIESSEETQNESEPVVIEHEEIESSEETQSESEPVVIEHEEIESSEETQSESEPVVEIMFTEEPVSEIPIEESIVDINENKELIVEIKESEEVYTEVPDKINPQIIEFREDPPDEYINNEVAGEDDQEKEDPVEIILEDNVEITGKYLKKIRESRKLKVRDVGEILNVEYKSIVHIESEKFDKLNDAGYLRWIIRSYSKFLGLNEEKSAEDYMKRYRLK